MSEMTDAQMFEALVKRGIDGSWNECGKPENGWGVDIGQWHTSDYHLVITHHTRGDEYYPYQQILFSHSFARALFGDDKHSDWTKQSMCGKCGIDGYSAEYSDYCWQFHLQQAVISDNPIKYMYEAVFGE